MSFLKSGFLVVISIHGLIHILGFIKAFDLLEVSQLTQNISKPLGWLWLISTLLFTITAVNLTLDKRWAIIAIVAVVLSQILIIYSWNDAKFGSLANLIILITALITLMSNRFKDSFIKDSTLSIQRSEDAVHETLINDDIYHLPIPVQKYLHIVDVVGKPKTRNMKVVMNGQMRSKDGDWFNFNSVQYSTFDKFERLFFMDAIVNKLPTSGYHYFKNKVAKMDIKLLSIFPIVSKSSESLRIAETVTLFNDMCIMAPASLIDKNIKWEEINENQVLAYFTNEGITIKAKLFFDNDGALINFYSDDRIDINTQKTYGFSTPISGYKERNGYLHPTYGEAIWHYPEGKFVYGKFDIQSINYNEKQVQ